MAFYLDVAALIDMFGTELTVYPKSNGGKWVEGQWTQSDLVDPITVNEAFFPLGQIGKYSTMLGLSETGNSEKYEYEWLSTGKYEMGTIVKHGDTTLVVRNKDDYTDYSNATIYYLSATENDKAKEAESNGEL